MSYLTREQISNVHLPEADLQKAFDFDGDGQEDEGAFDALADSVSLEIDGLLEGRFAVPLGDPPATVRRAAVVFFMEQLFRDRRAGERNPWSVEARRLRDRLTLIGAGKAPLSVEADAAGISEPPGVAVTGDNGAASSAGHMAF